MRADEAKTYKAPIAVSSREIGPLELLLLLPLPGGALERRESRWISPPPAEETGSCQCSWKLASRSEQPPRFRGGKQMHFASRWGEEEEPRLKPRRRDGSTFGDKGRTSDTFPSIARTQLPLVPYLITIFIPLLLFFDR